jgi:hypothetical protein
MNIRSLNPYKVICLVFILILASCSKDQNKTENVPSHVQKGSLYGNVQLYSKYGTKDSNFTDLRIELIDSLNIHRLIQVNSNGSFLIDSISYGIILLKIEKSGYGVIDTLSFSIHKIIDTLSTIKLAEELPFCYNSFSVYYSNGMIHYQRSTNYQSNDSYLVGELICFGKNSDVSLNNCDFFMGTGSYSNVKTINWTTGSATNCSLKNFTNSGSKIGDKVYAVCYPIIHASFTLYDEQNFSIVSYKIGNPSPISSFFLQE